MTNEEILNIINERNLHCVLNKFCLKNLNIKTKTIFHEKSTKNKGKSEWLHPDMVGFELTTSNWDSNIIEVCKNFYVSKANLYSFELKKSISLDNLREYYFQAVSNSSWANEGYLVTAHLDESNTELVSELNRLVGAFGIGIIKLDILNPENSSIFLPAKRKDALDGETMNKLYSINSDYRDFIHVITNSLKINHIVEQYWDNPKDYTELVEKINLTLKNNTKNTYIDQNNFNTSNINQRRENLNNNIEEITFDTINPNLLFTKPIYCRIKNKEYIPTGWSNLTLLICKNLKEENYETFKIVTESSKMFSTENKKDYIFKKELGLYYLNRNANNSFKEIVNILNICNIPLNECLLRYEKTK